MVFDLEQKTSRMSRVPSRGSIIMDRNCRCSSVAERIHGKDEVGSSILPNGSSLRFITTIVVDRRLICGIVRVVVRMLASAGMAIEIEHYTFGVGTEVVKSRLWRDPAKAKRRRGG